SSQLSDGVADDLLEESRADLEHLLVDRELGMVQGNLGLLRTPRPEAHVAAGDAFQVKGEVLAAHAGIVHGSQPAGADHLERRGAGQLGLPGAVDHWRAAELKVDVDAGAMQLGSGLAHAFEAVDDAPPAFRRGRSEERRVGKEWRSRLLTDHQKKTQS